MFPFQPSPYESVILTTYNSGKVISTHSLYGAPPDAKIFPSQSVIDQETSPCQEPPSHDISTPLQTSTAQAPTSPSASLPEAKTAPEASVISQEFS